MQQHEIREIPEYLLESVVGGDHWCRENNIADSIGDESWSMLPDNISNYYSTGDQGISNTSASPNNMGMIAAGLTSASFILGVAGQATRWLPGAQVLSAGLSIMALGTGALAGAASRVAR